MSIRTGGAHLQTTTVKRRAYFSTQDGAMKCMVTIILSSTCRLVAAETGPVPRGIKVVWNETLAS